MSTILPEGTALRKAVKWISDQTQHNPDEKVHKFVNEAIAKFDLSPKDADFLINFYRKR